MIRTAADAPVTTASDEGNTRGSDFGKAVAHVDGVFLGDGVFQVLVRHGKYGREILAGMLAQGGHNIVQKDHPRFIIVGDGAVGGPDPGGDILWDAREVIDIERGFNTGSRRVRIIKSYQFSNRIVDESSEFLEQGEIGGCVVLTQKRHDGLHDALGLCRGGRDLVEGANGGGGDLGGRRAEGAAVTQKGTRAGFLR